MRNSLVLLGVTPLWHVAQWVSRAPPHHTLPAFRNHNGIFLRFWSLLLIFLKIWLITKILTPKKREKGLLATTPSMVISGITHIHIICTDKNRYNIIYIIFKLFLDDGLQVKYISLTELNFISVSKKTFVRFVTADLARRWKITVKTC